MLQRSENIFRLRIILIVIALGAFLATLFIGATGTVSLGDAQAINRQVNGSLPAHPTVLNLTPVIFENNFRIALFGFIPFLLGAFLLLFIGYNTGLAFSAQALIRSTSGSPITGPELVFTTLILPFFFWELAGYTLTMTEGIIITRGLIKGNRIERFIAPGHFRDGELFKALMVLAATAIVLLIAALMESYLIVALG